MPTSASKHKHALGLGRFLPASLNGEAALSHLSNDQRAALFDWSGTQLKQSGGQPVNLMDWPGWCAVPSEPSNDASVGCGPDLAAA